MIKGLNKSKKRCIYIFAILAVMMIALCLRTGYIQIVKGEEYAAKADRQQTKNKTVTPKRGKITDRNGETMAVSATTYVVWARPASITKEQRSETAGQLAELLDLDKKEVTKKLKQESVLVKIARDVEEDTVEKVKEADLKGIEITQGSTRYYPMKTLAAQVLGNVSADGDGLAGLELQYNDVLNGISGRQVEKTDPAGRSLSVGGEETYQEQDGLNVVTTLDAVIQSHVEKAIKSGKKTTNADKVTCLMMNPETGEILACATTESYDPNNARTPLSDSEAARVEKMSSQEQSEYFNKMWRNPLVSDTYEPGSTFKLLTLSATLEEKKAKLSDHFHCSGTYNVDGTILKCWRYENPHGDETLKEAVGNSCNPVFIRLGKRLGVNTFYKYLDLFGITEKTGVDYPGEAQALIQDKNKLTSVDFATMSYGQGISVTPIQLLTAVSAIGNEGKLVQPRMVSELTDSDGKTVKTYDTEVVRQVISQDTANEVKEAMEYVVEESGGTAAKVKGYTIGGKTGTAEDQSKQGGSKSYYASFVGLAPIDDPKVAILVVVDDPKGKIHGSEAAAPIVKEILEKSLPYLDSRG